MPPSLSSKSRSPTSSRKRSRHPAPSQPYDAPLDLLRFIPPPDSSSDENEDDVPESPKRRKANGDATTAPNHRGFNGVNTALPTFNSNNIKLARPGYDISFDEGDSSQEELTFSQKPKGKSVPKSSRFVYDEGSDLSSGEETSIPGTISRSKSDGSQSTQKVPRRAISELGGAERAVAESQDSQDGSDASHLRSEQDSDDDLIEKSHHAGGFQATEPPRGSSDSEDSSPAETTEESDAGANRIQESTADKSGSSDSEEEPVPPPRTKIPNAGTKVSTENSTGEESDSSGSEEEPASSNARTEGQSSPRGENARTPFRTTSQARRRDRNTKNAPSSKPMQGPGAKGRLASREDQILNGTIEKFLVANELTDERLPSLVKGEIEDTAEAKRLHEKFWRHVYQSLPHRAPRYVRAILKRRHTSYSARKEWTSDEDTRLVELAKEHEEDAYKWLLIGPKLGRTANECRDRYRNYAVCGKKRNIGKWEPDELRALLQAVSKFVPEDAEDGDLNNEVNVESRYKIDWLKVSEDMDRVRSRQQCLAKWTKMDVEVRRLRVRQLLHGRQPRVSPELRIVLMQVYSQPEMTLREFVQAVAEHEVDSDKPIPWRKLAGGALTKEMRVETLNIIWVRLRNGLGKGMHGKPDTDVASRMYDIAIEERCLEQTVARHEDIGTEEELVRKPWRGLSTRASSGRGESRWA